MQSADPSIFFMGGCCLLATINLLKIAKRKLLGVGTLAEDQGLTG
jgi:hypothetical protein